MQVKGSYIKDPDKLGLIRKLCKGVFSGINDSNNESAQSTRVQIFVKKVPKVRCESLYSRASSPPKIVGTKKNEIDTSGWKKL